MKYLLQNRWNLAAGVAMAGLVILASQGGPLSTMTATALAFVIVWAITKGRA